MIYAAAVGSRANVAIRQDGRWTHHGSNGLGYGIDTYLALGPGPAVALFRSDHWPVWDRDEWQHEGSAEGGALIDLDARDLLIFFPAGYGDRLVALDVLARTWPGWTVRWAWNGIADITDALGLDRRVLHREPWDGAGLLPRDDRLRFVITVDDVAYRLGHAAVAPWAVGPALLDQLGGLPRAAEPSEIPRGGLHLDTAARTAGVWSIDPVAGLIERFAARWPGWTLEFWADRCREQELRGAVRFADPPAGRDEHARVLAQRVARDWIGGLHELRDCWSSEWWSGDGNGTREAGLTVADLQSFADMLCGPEAERLDIGGEVAARIAHIRRLDEAGAGWG